MFLPCCNLASIAGLVGEHHPDRHAPHRHAPAVCNALLRPDPLPCLSRRFASIARLAGEQLGPKLAAIIPRLYRYLYDPNGKASLFMTPPLDGALVCVTLPKGTLVCIARCLHGPNGKARWTWSVPAAASAPVWGCCCCSLPCAPIHRNRCPLLMPKPGLSAPDPQPTADTDSEHHPQPTSHIIYYFPQVRDAMAHIWHALLDDPKAALTQHFDGA